MELFILRMSSFVYLLAISGMMILTFNQDMGLQLELQEYMKWWYAQTGTEVQMIVVKLQAVALAVSFIGAAAILFRRKWGSYLFLFSVSLMVGTEWLAPGYSPRSSIVANLSTIASISIGCILMLAIFSDKGVGDKR